MKNTTLIATTLGGVVALAVGTAIVVTASAPNGQTAVQSISTPATAETVVPDEKTSTEASEADKSNTGSTTETRTSRTKESATNAGSPDDIETLLAYLIEEEKLAHDIYRALGDEWGTQIFTNISSSESQHQSQVASLLAAYDIDDPRTAQPGVFVNDELQALYDSLMAKGLQSVNDALEVGVLIEETDIRDLQVAINDIDDASIDSVLERLLNASKNHLAAFSRQL